MAWREFRRGKSKKRDVQEFEFNLEDNIFQLHEELRAKVYRHLPYAAFYITDPKLRHIHKACIRDRVVHHAVFRILYPVFDPTFIFDSYSCRLGKGTHRAVSRLKKFARALSLNYQRNIFVLKCDVKKFFDSVNHRVLLEFIQRKIKNKNSVWLIKTIVGSFEKESSVGLPIGNVTSQLFANIYLNEFDQFVKHALKVKYYIRYCDDFVILGANPSELVDLVSCVGKFLNYRLKLVIHPDKVTIRKYRQGIDFLGYVVRPHCITLRTKTRRRLLKILSTKNMASYFGTLKHCDGYKIEQQITKLML